jgi:hypothetical protein
VVGTNFRLPPPPPAVAGKLPPPVPTVRVSFGAEVSSRVRVLSANALEALAPIASPGIVNVTVTNLDDDGDPIAGETVTASDAFTYARPKLTDQPDLDRVNRQLLIELKRQVLDNVGIFSHVDFDDVVGGDLDVAFVGKLPALALAGPDITEDRPFYSTNERLEIATSPSTYEAHKAPLTVRLGYEVVTLTEFTSQLMALQTLLLQFFERNKFLRVPRNPADPSAGHVAYEMAWEVGTTFRNTTRPNQSNVKSYVGNIVVRGVLIEHMASFTSETLDEAGQVVDDVSVEPPVGME